MNQANSKRWIWQRQAAAHEDGPTVTSSMVEGTLVFLGGQAAMC